MNDAVKFIVNHEAAVIDGLGNVWLPYLIQNGDGTLNRLGVIRREALCTERFGDAVDYDHATGTTCRHREEELLEPTGAGKLV